jgi:Peptidase family M28/FlgD Ig-like domain
LNRTPLALALLAVLSFVPGAPVAASPFSPDSLDADIGLVAEQVSADSLESYIATMQGFFTRHTSSDTTSATTGVGAARRWVHDRFAGFGLDVSYHDYNTTVSGINQLYRNVVAEIRGAGPGAERIYVIGAHLDSRNDDVNDPLNFAPGADDNASGVACVLECARVMATRSWPMTLRFIAFTGEEQGLIGSDFYARDAQALGEPIAAMIANDVMSSIVGASVPDTVVMADTTKARAFAKGPEDSAERQLQRYLKGMGDVYVPIQDIVLIPAEDRPSRGSDHKSFTANGYTAIRYMEYLEELYRQHSVDGDTLGPHLSMSYARRNVQVDIATLGNLAKSPASPAGLTVGDIGDSTGFRLIWPSTNPEPNLARYLVTMRTPGTLDYDSVIDAGLANELVVPSPPADSIYFGLSVETTTGHRALITHEVLGTLSSVPNAPRDLVVTSLPASLRLDWDPNAETDLAGYHVYRSETPGSGYAQLTGSPLGANTFEDVTAKPHTHYYYVVTALDTTALESAPSDEDSGQLTTLDGGVLFVDETKNGGNAWFPTDALADSAYAAQMGAIPFDYWEVDDSGIPRLADLGAYSSVMWIGDDYNTQFNGIPYVTQLLGQGVAALEAYMALGGNVMVAGWGTAHGVSFPLDYPLTLAPGDFLYDRFGVGGVTWKSQPAFAGATGQGILPDVALEPTRLRSTWNGTLTRCEYFTAVRPGSEVGFLFQSNDPDSSYHLQPCATYTDHGAYRTAYWGIPLYHLTDASANDAITAVLTFFGEFATTGAPESVVSLPLTLGHGRPNPFRGETEISFTVPNGAGRLSLTVYDLAGRRVRDLVSGAVPAGWHSVRWDGVNDEGHRVAAGVYFTRLQNGNERLTRKLVLLR